MKLAKPQWNLLINIVPPIFSSVMFFIFFPDHLFQFLIGVAIFSTVLGGWTAIKNLSVKAIDKSQNNHKEPGVCRWLFSLSGLIFLLGISSIFFMFLTAASQLSPEKLYFGELVGIWQIIFPTGMGILMAHIVMVVLTSKKILPPLKREQMRDCINRAITPFEKGGRRALFARRGDFKSAHQSLFRMNDQTREKMQISSRIFLQLSSFAALVISLSVVILTMANGLARWIGFEIPTGFQLQTMIGSTLIFLPFLTKKWQKRRFLKLKHGRRYRLFKLALGLAIAIILLSALTLPVAGVPIRVQFLNYGLTIFQWKLFILAWWVGITPLIASRIIQLSNKKSLLQITLALVISASFVYSMGAKFLLHGGEEYFLAVVREGILALILTALPVGGLILTLLPFQKIRGVNHKEQSYLTHSLMQGTVFACVLYWVTGLSILMVLFLMIAVPCLMMFLLVEMKSLVVETLGKKAAVQPSQ